MKLKNLRRASKSPRTQHRVLVMSFVTMLTLMATGPAEAALASGRYRSDPNGTVEERGDRVTNEVRTVPLSATFVFDLEAAPPSVTALIPNAVLEGGDPFALTVRSSYGSRLANGTYLFRGDYLEDIHPSGTQYLFEWRFSTASNGQLLWNGVIGWAGGHIWQITISNITITPDPSQPKLEIVRAGDAVTVSWPATHQGYTLEQTTQLPAPQWTAVTNGVEVSNGRFAATIGAQAAQSFFRLRKQ